MASRAPGLKRDVSGADHVAAVHVVTGRGLHSGPEGPRLLPAVKRYLDEQRISYIELLGSIDIPIRDD